jgi:hypothetical protein
MAALLSGSGLLCLLFVALVALVSLVADVILYQNQFTKSRMWPIVAWTFTKSDIWLRLAPSATAVYPTADSPAGCTTGTLCISRKREMFTLEMDPTTPVLDPRSSTGQEGRACSILCCCCCFHTSCRFKRSALTSLLSRQAASSLSPQRPASVTAALWSAWSSYPQTTHLKVCWLRRLARSTS